MSRGIRMSGRLADRLATVIVVAGMVSALGITGCTNPDTTGSDTDGTAVSDTESGGATKPSSDTPGAPSETTVYYEEPSLDDLPENRTADEIMAAVDDYLGRAHPDKSVREKELIGEFTDNASSMWASYVIHFDANNDIGLEVVATSTAAPTVTEERYLKAANGLYYDVETKQYVTDLDVFGGFGESEDDAPQDTPQATETANPEDANKEVVWVKSGGKDVRVVVGDLEP